MVTRYQTGQAKGVAQGMENQEIVHKESSGVITGNLSHAVSVVRPGHTFLQKLFTLLHGTRAPHHFAHLCAEAQVDLAW